MITEFKCNYIMTFALKNIQGSAQNTKWDNSKQIFHSFEGKYDFLNQIFLFLKSVFSFYMLFVLNKHVD